MMYNWGWGYGGLGMIFMALFWVFVVVGIVLLVKWISGAGPGQGMKPPGGESALDVLKKRYASGEISKEEFEEKKKDLL